MMKKRFMNVTIVMRSLIIQGTFFKIYFSNKLKWYKIFFFKFPGSDCLSLNVYFRLLKQHVQKTKHYTKAWPETCFICGEVFPRDLAYRYLVLNFLQKIYDKSFSLADMIWWNFHRCLFFQGTYLEGTFEITAIQM